MSYRVAFRWAHLGVWPLVSSVESLRLGDNLTLDLRDLVNSGEKVARAFCLYVLVDESCGTVIWISIILGDEALVIQLTPLLKMRGFWNIQRLWDVIKIRCLRLRTLGSQIDLINTIPS